MSAAVAPETWTFYCPTSPFEGIKVAGRVEPIRFAYGVLETADPSVAEGVRGANKGAYHEADLPVGLRCRRCGAEIRSQTAYELHLEDHIRKEK